MPALSGACTDFGGLRAMVVLPSDEDVVLLPKKLCDLFVIVVEPVLVSSLFRP